MAAVRGAEEAGASSVPRAALHLKLAEEQIAHARTLMENGENERADAMTIRAYNDAELAVALAREEAAQRRLATFEDLEARENVRGSGNAQLEAARPGEAIEPAPLPHNPRE
jgi:hypothetical protein